MQRRKRAVIAGMLLASRDIIGGVDRAKSEAGSEDIAKKAEKEKKKFAGCELMGKKLGIIGLGAIGIQVANVAECLGMDVYGYDPYISVDAAWKLSKGVKHIKDVDDIYRTCDYITIHVPLLDSTRKMINQDAINLMKENVVILNFARDMLVDEEAVVKALKRRKSKEICLRFPEYHNRRCGKCDHHPSSGCIHRRIGRQLCKDGSSGTDGILGKRKYHQFCKLSELQSGRVHTCKPYCDQPPQRKEHAGTVYRHFCNI